MKLNRKRIIKISLILICLFAIGVTGMYLYVSRHKKEMLELVQEKFNDSYNGTLTIRDIEPDLWKQFPNVSLVLHDVVIRDTMWDQHKTDFLNIKHVYLKLKFWPLLAGKIKLSKLIVTDASMTLFENRDSVTNKGIFAREKKKDKEKKDGGSNLRISDFTLENFHFKFTHHHNKKHFEFQLPHLDGRVDELKDKMHFHTNGIVHVNQFIFNTDKGSYFRDKDIRIDINFFFNTARNLLQLNQQVFQIDGSKLSLTGDFYLGKADNWFTTDIHSDQIDYRQSLTWVPPTVKKSLDSFTFFRPINLDMHIEGRLKDQRIPYVVIKSQFTDNKLESKFGKFDSLSFKLHYVNGSRKDSLYGDEHSLMTITNMKGLYSGIPFSSDSTRVFNLKLSQIRTHIKAAFPIAKLNKVFGRKSFLFGEGSADIELRYEGGLKKEAPYPTNISAKIDIRKAELTYLPRQLQFNNCNVFLQVKDNDIQVVESVLHTRKSEIRVAAVSRNFISLYRSRPDEIVIDATVRSEKVDLNEFQSFLQRRGSRPGAAKSKSSDNNTPDFLDEALDVSRTNLDVALKNVVYKRFEAKDIKARLTLLEDGIDLHQVSLQQSGGNINMSGRFSGSNSDRPSFAIEADIRNASIDKLLYSFDNFGQKSFAPENLRGTIDLKSKVSGYFNASAQLMPRSLNGTASFEIRKGELIDFKPLQRMGKLVFRKERLANVHFEKIKNTLDVQGSKIHIPPMWVNTDLLDMQIQGVYNLDIGTDILIEVPLFRFSKADIAADSTLSDSKGFRLYIQAKDNEEGEMKFSLKLKNSDISEARQERKRLKEQRKRAKKQDN